MSDSGRPSPVIEVSNVHKTFGTVRALQGVDLRVETGEFVAISGPSGSGKSTLLHLLAGLDAADAGRVVVRGQDLSQQRGLDHYRRHEIGLVFQLHNLLPHLDARRNVEIPMFGTRRSSRHRREDALELLRAVQLDDKAQHRPPELSGGERQRVAIARALANHPSVLLADEPTGNLDSASVRHVLGLLARLRAERELTIVMITHDPIVAAAADQTLTMRDGRIADSGREV